MPEDMVALRCKYCGAPLDAEALKGDSPYVTCSSCGTTMQKVDAREYLDQLMGQVKSWLNRAVPGGAGVSGAQVVDPVARYNIFMNSVKPRIDPEFTEYRFHLMSLLANQMMAMPFDTVSVRPGHSSSQVFEFGARLKSVEPLTVGAQESSDSLSGDMGIVDAYAVLINNCKLLSEDKPGRYMLMFNNFTTAASDFESVRGEDYSPAAKRFRGLAELCRGCDSLLNGDVTSSYPFFERGKSMLEEALRGSDGNVRFAIMAQAVRGEIAQATTLQGLADRMQGSPDPLKTLDTVRRLNGYKYPQVGGWSTLLNSRERSAEIYETLAQAVSAKSGSGATIAVASGPGDLLVPFWNVRLRYSFQTGSLWKKHAVTVDETVLVCADFPSDPGCLSDPRSAVTDVFSAYKGGYLDSITGSESSISGGEGLKTLVSSAAPAQPGSRGVVVPLSTRKEADRLAEQYVAQSASSNSKIKLSNPEVVGLIYVPCASKGDSVEPNPGFGRIAPARVRRMDKSKLIIVRSSR